MVVTPHRKVYPLNSLVAQKQIQFQENSLLKDLFGTQNAHVKRLETLAGVQVNVRGNVANLSGEEAQVERAAAVLQELYQVLAKGHQIGPRDVEQAFAAVGQGGQGAIKSLFADGVSVNGTAKLVAPKSVAQQAYLRAIREKDLVFGIGPAGTGKTYLAIAAAVEALHQRRVRRIILTRPAVEAGEKLGFLPGNIAEKIDPYLRPLFDALHEMMDADRVLRAMERQEIELAPLAFMRGRTLNDAFVILDEGQNTTSEQMKMFLTRMGMQTKMVVTGDVTQIDLPTGRRSGLVEAQRLLSNVEGISVCNLSHLDVVRHPLVRAVLQAYDKADEGA